MARILMLTPQVPYPPRQGTALRNWGLLQGLAAHHQLSLLTFVAPDQETTPHPRLVETVEHLEMVPQPTRRWQDRLRTLLTTRYPDLAMRLWSEAFRERLAEMLDHYAFDWVQVEGLEMAPYLEVVWSRPAHPRVVFDDHNCEYLLQKRAFLTDLMRPLRWPVAAYSCVQWLRLRRYEREVCRRADLVIAVSEADATALRKLVPDLDPLVIPNGITVVEYAGFTGEVPLKQPAFVFTGTMDFRPNVDGVLWFVRNVWPLIRRELPGAHFYVVGRRPHARLEPLREVPGVVITGSVPETQPYINAATVFVVPLQVGGGTRLKLLEATALGKVVVSTTLGAEGYARAAEAMVLADDPRQFAEACVRLAQDPEARAQLIRQTAPFVAEYEWSVLLPPLLARLEGG